MVLTVLWVFLAGVAWATAALTPRIIVPAETDPAITNRNPLHRHWVYLDSAAPRAGKLFVFLPGTGAPPNVYRLILETASGRKSKSEEFGYGDDEFAPWTIGATM